MTQSNSLLPPNATQLQKDLEAATTLRLLSLNVDALRYLNDPDNCLEEFLPWIAWAMSVDIWNNDWEAVTKRKVVRESLLVHRQKGTLGALRRTLESFLFAKIRITEWFEYNGEPYTFRVYAVYREAGMSLTDAAITLRVFHATDRNGKQSTKVRCGIWSFRKNNNIPKGRKCLITTHL